MNKQKYKVSCSKCGFKKIITPKNPEKKVYKLTCSCGGFIHPEKIEEKNG